MIRQAVKNTLMLIFLLFTIVVSQAEDAAVLVGINDYNLIMPDLKYCENDVKLMKETFVKYLGIEEENIKVLLGKEAKRNAIRDAIRDWLKNRVEPGDKAIFYFSGHGVQFEDKSGDEEDGKDELLCAYDSGMVDVSFVKDDNLNSWFSEINTDFKLVILDCCHSGTGTKEVLPRTPSDEDDYPTIKEGRLPEGMEIQSSSEDLGDGASESVFAEPVLISGCRADQVSMETPKYGHGVLTYYFTQVLNSMADMDGDKVVTIEEATKETTKRIKMAGWRQDPQLEGSYKDKALIGKKELQETTYGTITALSANVITISLGQEHNVVKGSIYNVFDSTATSFADANYKGRILVGDVMRDYSYAKQVEASQTLRIGDKVVEYKRHFQSEKLLLLVEPFGAKSENSESIARKIKELMEKALGKEKHVEIVSGEKAPDKILRGSVEKTLDGKYVISVHLVNVNLAESWKKYEIETSTTELDAKINELAELLSKEIRYSYILKSLAQLENTQSRLRINLAVSQEKYYIRETNPEKVVLTVNPNRDCYIYLLNIGSSGTIDRILPNPYDENNFVRAGQEYVIPSTDEYAFEVGGPPGQEFVKAIATSRKIPFEMINPDDMDNVQDILDLTMKDLKVKPLNQWATESVTYQVIRE